MTVVVPSSSGDRQTGLPRLSPDNQTVLKALGGNAGSFLNGHQAQEPLQVITADCSNPREIDDGIHVEALDDHHEKYRVGVCAAYTAHLFSIPEIRNQAFSNREASYGFRKDGTPTYHPMFERGHIKELELAKGSLEKALVVSFTIGKDEPISDVSIEFRPLEVTHNFDYREFHRLCRDKNSMRKYGRAATLIINNLRYGTGNFGKINNDWMTDLEVIHNATVNAPSKLSWKSGSRLNEAFMVAAGYAAGGVMEAIDWPAIFRLHDPEVDDLIDFMPAINARFGTMPGAHVGLNLERFCRVTSPLRRLEDFVMNYVLWKYASGQDLTMGDVQSMQRAVATLNDNIAHSAALKHSRKKLTEAPKPMSYLIGTVWPLREEASA